MIHNLHLDDETVADLKRLSELLAIPQNDYASLIKKIARIALAVKDPMAKKQSKTDKTTNASDQQSRQSQGSDNNFAAKLSSQNHDKPSLDPLANDSSQISMKTSSKASSKASPNNKPSRYIPKAVKDWIWKRDEGRCTFVDPITKRRCTSRFGLQYDHVVPLACGGKSTAQNLRLRCFAHNLLEAQRVFGRKKMQSYTNRST